MSNKYKKFLNYKRQIIYLNNIKKIKCDISKKYILVKEGYFNLINGYKTPFILNKDEFNKHIYLENTTIQNIYKLKLFDEELRILLLKYITNIEKELKNICSYKFDYINLKPKTQKYWDNIKAYDDKQSNEKIQKLIEKISDEISRNNKLEYLNYYKNNYKYIPTWIVLKVISFATLIDFIEFSKKDLKYSICDLYDFIDDRKYKNLKLLKGSLHLLRTARNFCAHNERIYNISIKNGRILEKYFKRLGEIEPKYLEKTNKKFIDIVICLKYYLDWEDFSYFTNNLSLLLFNLKGSLNNDIVFNNILNSMGIYNISHLSILLEEHKHIDYNSF